MKKKNKKRINKNKKVILIIILLLVVIGGIYFSYNLLYANKISIKTIERLRTDKKIDADIRSHINTTTIDKFLFSFIDNNAFTLDGILKDANKIYVSLENGKIYLENGKKKSKILDINEKIIFMANGNDYCYLGSTSLYFLTENKNLYVLTPEAIGADNTALPGNAGAKKSVISNLLLNKSQKLGIQRINGKNKVLAFTNYIANNIGEYCSAGTMVVYTSDKNLRIIGRTNINTVVEIIFND